MNEPSGKIIKILIVEDDRLEQKAMIRLFDALPLYQHTICSSIKEAREAIKRETFDIAILDGKLPDGIITEFFPHLGNTPFVVTTGTGTEDLAVQAYKNGAADYLIKDVDRFYLKLLPSTIEKALKKKELEQLKESFISTVSHELRTPLTVIGMGISNLKEGIVGPVSKEQGEVLERNSRNVKRLNKLIDNLLDLSRLESGRANIQRKELNLNSLIHEVLQSFQGVKEKFMKNLPEVEADPDMISQVLVNLLGNAGRYAKKQIVVSTTVVKSDDGTPVFVETSVFNDGPGIPGENLDKLFEKFVQLDRVKQKGPYKGTGLGLAICKEIIERHYGKIWVESAGEKGVTFHFTLPVREGGDKK